MDNRMQLYSHVVLSGGCTMLPGLTERMSRDIRKLYLDRVLQVRHHKKDEIRRCHDAAEGSTLDESQPTPSQK